MSIIDILFSSDRLLYVVWIKCFLLLLLAGCAHTVHMTDEFTFVPIKTDEFEIATWQKITDNVSPIHIYIEGDGNSFDRYGSPTYDPTPRKDTVRRLAKSDNSPNVMYMARPCQYIMSDACDVSDWTSGRFSAHIVNSVATAIKSVAKNTPVILVGYSGGAMISGLIISKYPDINVKQWITIAGVLNHTNWTQYFGDTPLSQSLDLNELPHIPQRHYVAEFDKVVPIELTYRMANPSDIIVVPNASHSNLKNITLDFIY